MLYLIFGTLLILGGVGCGLSFYMPHKKNRIVVKVVDSRLNMERNDESIKQIQIVHLLEFEHEGETKQIESDLIPVREIKDAKLHMYYNKEEATVYRPDFAPYISIILAFVMSGICCYALYYLRDFSVMKNLSIENLLLGFLAVVAVIAFLHMDVLINPSVIKTKGNYEGVICTENGMVEDVYSLWYGEHRQYTTRAKGMLIRKKTERPVVLFYNTKTGVARRIHELIISAVIGISALAAIVVLIAL